MIGKLREIHNWTNRPVWPQYTAIPSDKPPVPKGLNWDLWLGPTLDRPYHPHFTHAVFRGWFDFGGGSMADMGIYSLWPVFVGLGLGTPASCEARATHTCDITNNVSRVVKNDYAFPTACTLHFKFADARNSPPWISSGTTAACCRACPRRSNGKTWRCRSRASCSSVSRERSWPASMGKARGFMPTTRVGL